MTRSHKIDKINKAIPSNWKTPQSREISGVSLAMGLADDDIHLLHQGQQSTARLAMTLSWQDIGFECQARIFANFKK